MKIAICDDVEQICYELEKIVLEFSKTLNETLDIEIFTKGEEFVKILIDGNKYEFIFLDIEIGTITGIDIGNIIRNKLDDYITKIIYVSAKNQYDRQLFPMQPFDFLEKPLVKEKVVKVLKNVIKVIGVGEVTFAFKNAGKKYIIPVKDIIYFEAVGRQVKIVCTKNKYLFYEKFSYIYGKLKDKGFIQPHRSYIVNYEQITNINSDGLIMTNVDCLPVSRRKYKEVIAYHMKALRATQYE